jgi:hypothetical protein
MFLEAQQCSNNVPRHNERVKKSRVIFRLFVGAVCHVANQELQFRGHNESSTSLDKGNFTEFLNVLKNDDPILKKKII